jgi:phage gpG-like protein
MSFKPCLIHQKYNNMSNFQKSIKATEEAIAYLTRSVPTIMGVEAVNHFKDSFQDQGFTDRTVEKWQEVERRQEGRWKGFQYGSTVPRPGTKQRKAGAITNYSPAAETRPILSGNTLELMNSINWQKTATGIRVYASAGYAKIHNQGGPMSVFGKRSSTMPKRQFMGQSEVLRNRIRTIIYNDLNRIFK